MSATLRTAPAARRSIRRLVPIGLAIASLAWVSAPAAAQRVQFRKITPDDGLSAAWVANIFQDSRGFMWFGTRKGLDRYDGYSFATYRPKRGDSTSLADGYVEFVQEDRDSVLWVGTRRGLSRFDRAKDAFVNYSVGPGGGRPLQSMLHDRSGKIWLGTDEGLYQFDKKTGKSTRFAGSAAANLVGTEIPVLHQDRRGRIWIGTSSAGLKELDPTTGAVKTYIRDLDDPRSFPDRDIRGIVEDNAGILWVGTFQRGLVRVDPSSGAIQQFEHDPANPRSIAINTVQCLASAGSRGIWVGLENGGLDLFDPATGIFHHNKFDPNDPTGLNSNSIWSLHEDRSGTIWVGTFSGGVNIAKRNSEAIRTYRAVPGDESSLSFNSVLGFTQDSAGAVWVGTDGGGLNRFDPVSGRFSRYTMKNSGLNSDAVLAVAAEPSGAIWLGTWAGGVSRFDPSSRSFTSYTTKNSNIPSDNIFSVHIDRAGRLWAGSWQHGLLAFDRTSKSWSAYSYPLAQGERASEIWMIHELRDGRLALATLSAGLQLFDPNSRTMTSFRADAKQANSLIHDEVRALYESEPGVLWIGTGGGLDRLEIATKKFTHYSETDGLPSSIISGIGRGDDGQLWLSSDQGIMRWDPKTKTGAPYTVADGLQGRDFNARSYMLGRAGVLYFGGNSGMSVIRPSAIARNTQKPPVVLTGFQLFNKSVAIGGPDSPLQSHISQTGELRLSHKQSVFTFEFAALDYTAPAKNQYAYKLEGFDEAWNEVGNKRSAVYTNLAPGKYTFRVKGSNNDGLWNEQGASLKLVITPPFWKTWWFRLMVIAAVGGAINWFVRNAQARRRNLETINAQLAQVADRDRKSQQYLAGNVREMLGAMGRFSEGDLSVRLKVESDDEISELRKGFNTAVSNIRAMVVQVNDLVGATVKASRSIQSSTETLAAGAVEQIQQASFVASAAEQMTSVVADNARHIGVVAQMAQQSGRDAQEGGRVVRSTFASMDTIVSNVALSAQTVAALGQSSSQIGKMTRAIDELADQTNLLALNAAIEAARAGVHGRTFAIVADEIRELADRTAASTKEITQVVRDNESVVKEAVARMNEVSGHLESGRHLVDQAGSALDSIIGNSEKVLDSVKQVTQSSEEQAATTAHIGENIEKIARVTRDAAEGNQAIASSVQEMNALIEDLQTRVSRFRLEEDEPGVADPGCSLPATSVAGVLTRRAPDR